MATKKSAQGKARPNIVTQRAKRRINTFRQLALVLGDELTRLHPTGVKILESVVQGTPETLSIIAGFSTSQRRLLIGLLQGMLVEAYPELGRADMACRGQGHPFLRRNEAFLCLVPDYRPPRGIGIGIGVRTSDGNWEVEYGQKMSGATLRERFPRTQFFSWDDLICKLWRDRHVPPA